MNWVDKISKLNIEKRIIYAITAVCMISIVFYIFSCFDYSKIEISFYTKKSSKIDENMRIVLISDLHLREFGRDNQKLLDKIKALEPDMIAVAGDLTISGNPNYEPALALLRNLKPIAPVYYSFGNHEYADILFEKGNTLRKDLKNTGVHVVNSSYEIAEIKGNRLAIGGFCSGADHMVESVKKFLKEYSEVSEFKLLLCHRVEVFKKAMEPYPVDLALTGHAHGGQIRLPIIGGLFSPDQGLFPTLTEGKHQLCGSTVVISRGLGNSKPIPRFNNNPEIVVIDLKSY